MNKIQALSIRQPWAWLIVNGHKNIENRNWFTSKRGLIYIHAGKAMTKGEYETCCDFTRKINPEIVIPNPKELQRGGIVGSTTIIDCIGEFNPTKKSPWFMGAWGFVLEESKPIDFIPCKRSSLGFFLPEINSEATRHE